MLQLVDIGIRGWSFGIGISWEQGHAGMEPVGGEEWGQGGSRMFGVVVAKLRQGEEARPASLLIVVLDSQILFKD